MGTRKDNPVGSPGKHKRGKIDDDEEILEISKTEDMPEWAAAQTSCPAQEILTMPH